MSDLDGWEIVSVDDPVAPRKAVVRSASGVLHECLFEASVEDVEERSAWSSEHQPQRRAESDRTGIAQDLVAFGLAMVEGVVCEAGEVLRLADEIGFVRRTNYGQLFDVVTEPEPNNLAFTSAGLPLHTDNPYRDPCPSVQILHCLTPASRGGASRFSDGLAAAEVLQSEKPSWFDVLATTELDWMFADATTDLRNRRPMIEVDNWGTVRSVAVNHRSMRAPNRRSVDVDLFYSAYRAFADRLVAEQIEIELRAGDVAVFDNRRVLHGRSEFATTDRRHLQGCYVDIDAIESTARLG